MKITDQQVIDATSDFSTMRSAANSLGVNLSTFKERAKRLGVYSPNQGRKNIPRPNNPANQSRTIPILEILQGHHPSYQTSKLRWRLFHDKIKEQKCEICGTSSWQGHQLSLILDHINGINNDHRLENLRIVCPNCDSLLPTFCGRNKKRKL